MREQELTAASTVTPPTTASARRRCRAYTGTRTFRIRPGVFAAIKNVYDFAFMCPQVATLTSMGAIAGRTLSAGRQLLPNSTLDQTRSEWLNIKIWRQGSQP